MLLSTELYCSECGSVWTDSDNTVDKITSHECPRCNSPATVLSVSCTDPSFLVLMDKPARHVRFNQLDTVAIASTPKELVQRVEKFLKR
jgi:hypothetical protein